MPHFDSEWQVQGRQIDDRLNDINGTIYSQRISISGWEASVTGFREGPSAPPEAGWKSFDIGSSWGGRDVTTWFRASATVPNEMAGKRVVLLVNPGGESLMYIDGIPCQGLDGNREEVLCLEKAKGGETFDILIESYSGIGSDRKHRFHCADLAVVDMDIREFYWDARVTLDVIQVQPEKSASQLRMLDMLNACVKHVDVRNKGDERYKKSIAEAHKMLKDGIKPFEGSHGLGSLKLTGHSHIDTAWLWPLRETKRKCARTFSSVLKYMDEFPHYKFSQSQPQLYEYTKQYYPTIYEEIKKRVKEGRWEPVGAMWVEQDSNVSSGESLVRQAVYGNRFFRDEFGIHSRTCWLPDAFGFCWSLPQILRKAGVDFFATTKISWSQYTKFPYSMFMWQGIDGTKIMSIFPPLNYNGSLTVKDCLAQWDQFIQKDQCDEVVYSFGWGDGGGGPTKEMLETGIRLDDMVGVPKCSFGWVQEYFDDLEKNVDQDKLPVWNGGLYLELHRGCQTSQARTKRNNRKSELLYRDAEFLSSMAMLAGGSYQQDKLYEGWKVILCSQFHDILPGSSINEVYEDADRDYAEVLKSGNEVITDSEESVEKKIDTSGDGQAIIVTNTLSWVRNDVASIKAKLTSEDFVILDADGNQVLSQVVGKDGEYTEILFEANGIPPLGYVVYRLVEGEKPVEKSGKMTILSQNMENSLYAIELDEQGKICRLYDKAMDREVIPEDSCANILQFFADYPHSWDAWEIDFNYTENTQELAELESIEVVEAGPVKATVRMVRKTDRSTITQDVSIYNKLSRIDFVTNVDWWEKKTLLKVAFPVEVLSPRATYEIQFGTIERPTHFNTDWDRAKFEVPGQKWVDLSEGGYGVSLLNDCKYGYDVHDNVLRLSLLRSPISPDPHADEGKNEFTYSLHPHKGDWRDGETVQRAAELNSPLRTVVAQPHAGAMPKSASFAKVDKKHVIIDTVKKAEDTDDIIIRLYEAYGQRGKVTLNLGVKPQAVSECNLMEEEDQAVEVNGSSICFQIKPYEIRTFKVKI